MPRFTEDFLIPEELLKIISCSYETGYEGNRCGCRKHGLRFTDLCTKCRDSDNCLNVEKFQKISMNPKIILLKQSSQTFA